MKVGIWVKDGIDIHRGGAFSYQSKLLELIDDYDFSNSLDIAFITTNSALKTKKKEVILIESLEVEDAPKASFPEKILLKIPLVCRPIIRKYSTRSRDRMRRVKNVLKEHSVDVIYYLTQAGRMIPKYPFISTNWDVGHRSTFMFPEFYDPKSKENRIYWYSRGIHEALAVMVESESGKKELTKYSQINPDRVFVLPMFPGDIINTSIPKAEQVRILETFKLEAQQYFFYPAQFWAHKNHYNLILAFKKLNKQHPNVKLVLTGSDKGGNLSYILNTIEKKEIKGVNHLGFVEDDQLFTLYKNAIALVMPSFLGPTNMPPLEAIALGCPVICSNLDGHKEQLEDAALYVDPLDQEGISDALFRMMDNNLRDNLIEKGTALSMAGKFNQVAAIKALDENLEIIGKIRNAWGN